MKYILIDEVYICNIFPAAIANDDITGLTDEEVNQLDKWLNNYPHCIFEWGGSEEFTRCDISDMMASCVYVKIGRIE